MQRRTFIRWIAAASVIGTLPVYGGAVPDTPLWHTLEAAQNHLLPGAVPAPSAGEVNATAYLYRTMRHRSFDYEIRDFIFKGAEWLEYEAQLSYNKAFSDLDATAQEQVLHLLIDEYRRGEAWISTLISYTLEAMLSDPIYGGNVNEAGWKWLGHIPGVPRPEKRFVHDV